MPSQILCGDFIGCSEKLQCLFIVSSFHFDIADKVKYLGIDHALFGAMLNRCGELVYGFIELFLMFEI